MAELNIKQLKITNNNIKIDPELQNGPQRLNVSLKTKLNPPKDPDIKTLLLYLGIFANSEENNTISIEIEAQCTIEYDETPASFTGEFSEKCVDIAFKGVSDILDKTLFEMGYSALEVYGKTHKTE